MEQDDPWRYRSLAMQASRSLAAIVLLTIWSIACDDDPAPDGVSPCETASMSDQSRAEIHGCHPVVGPGTCAATQDPPECDAADMQSGLPCGACSEGAICQAGPKAACDCDGPGPMAPFTDGEYSDEWHCDCFAGKWRCWIATPSGASCESCQTLDGSVAAQSDSSLQDPGSTAAVVPVNATRVDGDRPPPLLADGAPTP